MRLVITWRRVCGAVIVLVGAGLLGFGMWQQSVSLSLLGLACWVAAALGLGILLLQRINIIKKLATAEGHVQRGETAVHGHAVWAARTGAPIYAGMASIPSRVAMLERAVSSIYDQVDHLFIYLNNYHEIPGFLRRERISVFSSQSLGDIKDSGKFYGLTRVKTGIYLSLDDDIEYPPDYAAVMQTTLARFQNKCVIGVHGTFFPTLTHSFFHRRTIHFQNASGFTVPVSMLGTGTTAFSIRESGIRFEIFKQHGMADISLGLFLKEHRIPAVVIRRDAGWLRSLSTEQDFSLYGNTKLDSTEHTAAIVAARPWGLPDVVVRVEHAGIGRLLPVPERWDALIAAYRGNAKAAELLAEFPLAMLSGMIRTLMDDCEAWKVARICKPKNERDLKLHCDLLRRCLSVYPEEVIAYCREACSRSREQDSQAAVMGYAGAYIAGLRKLSMDEEASEFYRELQEEQAPSADVIMEFLRLKAQEGHHKSVISLARAHYTDLRQFGDFVPVAYGSIVEVEGVQAALHAFIPSFFQEGRHAAQSRRAIIATCKQSHAGRLGESYAFEFAAAESAAKKRRDIRRFLDLVNFYVVLGEKERARTLLETDEGLVEERCGPAVRMLMFAVTANDHRDTLDYINKYNECCGLAPMGTSTADAIDENFFRSIETSGSIGSTLDHGKISVVITAFNAADTVEYAVRSILSQSYPNLEVIVVDDASTDGTWEVLEVLRGSDDRVNAVRNHVNAGPYACRNIGISLAQGLFVAIHDADDYAHPQRLERQIAAFDAKEVLAVFARHIRLDRHGKIALENNGEIIGDGPMTFMCKRSVFDEIDEFLAVRTRGDIEFRDRMRCYYGSHRIAQLDEVLVYALHDAESNSHNMVSSPEARRNLELFRASYNRRLMLMRSAEELRVPSDGHTGAVVQESQRGSPTLPLQRARG